MIILKKANIQKTSKMKTTPLIKRRFNPPKQTSRDGPGLHPKNETKRLTNGRNNDPGQFLKNGGCRPMIFFKKSENSKNI